MSRAEYVKDVAYPRSFVGQSSPATLRLIAAMNGVAPPPREAFTYCDLGCGTGETVATFAAANPGSTFFGVDFNPVHVEGARAWATKAGVTNVTYVEQDFANLAQAELPPLDMLVAHGIWTWVSAEKRQAILDFARERLKPGGLLYVSYNALPGWAALEPIRRLLLERTRHVEGDTLERARIGTEYLKELAAGGAAYFTSHPTAQAMLQLIERAKLPYVAHEYFHAHWEPMYSADVARSLAASGLSFVGQAPLHLNVRDLAVPPKMKELAKGIADRQDFETLKDFALNEPFRVDVFVKRDPGEAAPDEAVKRAFFAETTFGALVPVAALKREAQLPVYTLDYHGPLYDAVLRAMIDGPVSAKELAVRPELAAFGEARLANAMENLTLGGQVAPMMPMTKAPFDGVPTHNRVALADAVEEGRGVTLAAPAIGTGLPLSPLDAVALYVSTNVAVDKRKAWLRSFARRTTIPFAGATGSSSSDNDERARLLGREVDRFAAAWQTTLAHLGVA